MIASNKYSLPVPRSALEGIDRTSGRSEKYACAFCGYTGLTAISLQLGKVRPLGLW